MESALTVRQEPNIYNVGGNFLDSCPNLDIRQDVVTEFIIKDGTVQGVKTGLMCEFVAKCVILTSGTFS